MTTRYYIWCILRHRDMVLLGKKIFKLFPAPDVWYPPGGEIIIDSTILSNFVDSNQRINYLADNLKQIVRRDFNVDIKNIQEFTDLQINNPINLPIDDTKDAPYILYNFICQYSGRANIPSAQYAETRWVRIPELDTFPMLTSARLLFKTYGL